MNYYPLITQWFKKLLIINVFILVIQPYSIFSQAPKLKFKHISYEQNGLSNSTIESIFQDKKGFIWFATRDGLNRYDGYQVTIFRHDPKEITSISDNYIQCLYEDRDQTLWVGTRNGLNRFNRTANNYH
jgi:ligand-binding sensor domain-containing protein